jgi:hypothetical protein
MSGETSLSEGNEHLSMTTMRHRLYPRCYKYQYATHLPVLVPVFLRSHASERSMDPG